VPDLERFGVSIDHQLLEAFDRVIRRKGYPSRSEAIRDLIRDLLVREQWAQDEQPVAGCIALLYDHHTHGLEQRLTDAQHEYATLIHSTTHVHLDERHCLEVVVVSGQASRVRRLADRLASVKGVRHAQLAATAVAWETPDEHREHEHKHSGEH
jgi:CopG family nickel-responsive transcriptional regulator